MEVSGGIATSRVSANNDDGEEHRGFLFQGAMTRNRDELRLGNAGSQVFSPTLVGTRFRNLNIPQGATITNAYIEFTAEESFGGAGNLTILGEAIDDAPGLGNGYNNISSRTSTDAVVTWTDVPSWFSEQVYETPNISSIVQEIVNRSGWSSGNDMFFAYFGDARRYAYSYDGDDDKAPRLVVQYSVYPSNYIVEIDSGSILAYSAGASLTTPDKTEVEFNAKDEYSCDNSFGLRVVEICGNNTDDDFDGDTDCDDTDCGVDIVATNNGPVCAGAVVQLAGLVDTDYSGTTTYSWVGPDGFTSTEQNPTRVNATAAMAGTYTFTATNDNGCSSSSNTVVVIQVDCSGICDQLIQVTPTNPTECFLDNGTIFVTEYGTNPSFYQNSIDGTNWFESEHTYSNLTVGNYNIFLRDKVTGITCRTVNISLTVQDETIYTGENVSPASSCFAADGSIQLLGVVGTDRVSWISSTNPSYVLISTLSPTNTITGLLPGTYYVRVVRGNNDYCYSERIVEVPNSGVPCDNELCEGESRVNLFPNGDFGTGAAVNGSPLEIGATSYGYTPMTCTSPNDGQYSIINTTDCDGSGSPIFNAFLVTDDHTEGDINGYMMLVNASFSPDIALERTVTGLCEDTEYEFSLWINNIQPNAPIKPNLTFLINGVGLYNTGNITTGGWQKVGFTFFTGTNTSSIFSIRNNAPGGLGNDWAIDDVFVGVCQPEVVNTNTIDKCFDAKDETLDFVINDDNKQFIYYQFEESRDNGATWTSIGTPQIGTFINGTYTATLSFPAPLTNAYDGRQYTIILGTTLANLANGCEIEAENSTTLNIIACDEICTNNSDDDGDGLTPSYDPDCQDCPIGSITYHRWNNQAGNDIEELTTDPDYPNNPDVAETRTSFETAVNYGNQYGVRMVGYLHPIETGNYTFYVSSDDNSELYLSTDNLMSNKELIASVPGWASANNLTKYPSQTSVTINLQAGERYFIEGLQSEGGGGDHLQVFWSTPSNATPTIIAGQYLSPYGCEVCADGIDNDGNGLTDCEDPEGAYCFPEIANITVSPCQEDNLGDIATVSLDVSWDYAPVGADMIVHLGGVNRQIIDVSGGATSPQTVSFTIAADGSTNNPISLEWLNNSSPCTVNTTYDAPAACSTDDIGCTILYLCGDDKPEDGDAWDHGAIEYINENNPGGTLTPAFTKPDGSGLGLYDPMNNAATLSIDINDYSLIIVSPTTEGRISMDLIAALKDTPAAVLLQNYLIVDDLGMSASPAIYSFQTNLYTDNTTSAEIYNYNNINPNYTQVMTGADYASNADAYLWFNAGDQAAGINGVYFSYDETDDLPGVPITHGKRIFLGYHMNGLYYNAENGGAMPAPMSEWLIPATDFTTEGKNFWDDALLDAAAECACAFEISSVSVTSCVANAGNVGATIEVEISWLPNVTDNINVTANGSTQTVNVNTASSPVTLSFNIPADGSIDNLITALQSGTACEETATYDAPSTCGENAGDCPGPTVNAGPNITVCEGETVNLSATATQGDYNFIYSWDNGLGIGQTHSFVGTATGTANNVTDYTVTATDGNGCETTDIVRVRVLSNPIVSVTNSDEYCGQDNGTITFTFTNHTGRTGIEFSIDNGISYPYSANDNAGSFTTPGLSAGNYQLSARWGDNSCPIDLGSVNLSDAPAPIVTASVSDNDICEGETVTLSATGSNGTGSLTYVWNNGGGAGASVSVSPTTTTTYTVTVSDNQGCTDTDQVVVNVTSNFDDGGVIGRDESNCGSFNPANITNEVSPASGIGGTIQYVWQKRTSNGLGGWSTWSTISGATSLSYNPPTIIVTTQYRRRARRLPCTQWHYSNVVTKSLNDNLIVNAGTDINICAGESVTLSATGSGGTGVLNYSWDNGLGNGASHTFVPMGSSSSNVTTVYTVTVEDTEGCSALANVTVTVESEPSIVVNTSDEHCSQADGYISVSFIDNIDRTQIEFSIDGGATYPYTIQDDNGFFIIGNLSAGSYDLWARWGGGDCPVSIQSVILNNLEGISVVTSPDEEVCEGEEVMITATASGGTFPYLYTWSNGLGSGQTKRISPTVTTTYSVSSTDNFGCTAIDEVVVTVLPYTDEECSPCLDPVDLDGDGLCASRDCNDENPDLPAPVGSSCDDGNAFTTNDQIQQDSCTCVGDYIPCSTSLSISPQQPNYNDNGTPTNISDDTFTFDVTISGNGNGWTANGQTGSYGQTVTFGPYAVDAVGVSFDVLDEDNPNCRENISVNISSCIYSGVCTCCN